MRTLPVLAPEPARPPVAFLATSAPVRFGDGFHYQEIAEGLPFHWMSKTGRIEFAPEEGARFVELWVRSSFYDLSQTLTVRAGDEPVVELALVHDWNPVSVRVPGGADAVSFAASRDYPSVFYPGDGRELAVQVRSVLLHADAARHRHIERQHANRVRNLREMLEGRVALESTPPKLGIDIQGACNVKPPCVYCAWDFNKALEGKNVDVPFTRATLGEYGDFFAQSHELVNCSIGEPFMGKDMDELLDAFGERGKILEMTTNGQILTDTNIRKLLGRNVHLYISIDAATAETYAKLRNPRFDLVIENVRRLVAAKGGPGHLPLVYLVFMPMRANAHEADAAVRLCADLKVDRLVLRPLNDSEGVELTWDRAGYQYDYQKELLPFEELVRISGRVAELCRRLGVELSDQLDFGGSMETQFAAAFAAGRREAAAQFPADPVVQAPAAPAPVAVANAEPPALPYLGGEKIPVCTEPWSSLYILRRGVMPCCYGGQPIAPMSDFQQAWNSPVMQGIRRELLKGRFHKYCYDSPDCPIVKKSHEARELSLREEMQLRFQRIHDRMKRRGYGWPGRVYRQGKAYWITGTNKIRRWAGAAPRG